MKRVLSLALLATAAIGCGDGRERALRGLHGVHLTPVRAKPDFTLENTDGKPFHFAADTRGIVTLLYFGYTNCPDVCPQHLVNIAGALRHMSVKDQERVRVVFVTRDSPVCSARRLRGGTRMTPTARRGSRAATIFFRRH